VSTAIKIENLWKQYRLGVIGHQYLVRDVQSWWARVRGKEDPNLIVDQVSSGNGSESNIWALRDLSLEIEKGEALGIIGKNGAGKSTLLKIFSQVTAPTRGSIKIKGRVASLLEVGTGFHPELTGRENVLLNGAILGMSVSDIKKKFDEIVDFSGIEKFIDTPVKRYSSGMYVRLAFAVAAHLDSEILILDEVLSVGDMAFQQRCLDRMQEVAADGRTILFVSHGMGAIRKFCRRVILLQEGRVVEDGPADEAVDRYMDQVYEELGEVCEADTLDDVDRLVSMLAPDPVFRLVSFSIVQDGVPTLSVINGRPLEARIEYEVLQETAGLFVCLGIFASDGSLIFESLHNSESSELPVVQPGRYISTATIPAEWLAPATYGMGVSAAIYGVRACMDAVIKCRLHVAATGRVNQAYPRRRIQGQISPYVPWVTESIVPTVSKGKVREQPHTVNLEDDGAGLMAICQIALRDKEGEPTRVFDLDEEICVSMDYVVRQSISQSMIVLTVSRGGVHFLSTHDTDLNPDLLVLREKGEYVSTVRLPGRLLTPGTYTLTVSAVVGATGEHFHRSYRFVLNFTIRQDLGNDLFKNYNPVRGTLMLTEWKWQTLRRVSPAPTVAVTARVK